MPIALRKMLTDRVGTGSTPSPLDIYVLHLDYKKDNLKVEAENAYDKENQNYHHKNQLATKLKYPVSIPMTPIKRRRMHRLSLQDAFLPKH